jgi:hypothetical protein
MARPRKPSAILELNGAFQHDPQRRRPNEPIDVRPIGYAPKRLPPEALPFWKELIEMLPGPILTFRDRWAVELAARLMCKAVTRPSMAEILALAEEAELDAGDLKQLVKQQEISSAELSTLRSLLASLGMTPADRSKLSVPTEKPKNRFAAIGDPEAASARPN